MLHIWDLPNTFLNIFFIAHKIQFIFHSSVISVLTRSRMFSALATFLLLGQESLAFQPFLQSHVRHQTTHASTGLTPINTIHTSSSTSLNLGDFFNFGKKEDTIQEEDIASTATSSDVEEEEEEAYYDEDDPIEKIFGVFFGKKEKSPMGMARFGQSKFPEQYPATLDTWADPVDTDDKEMAILRPFLKNTNLESRSLKLTYDANRDGWDPTVFHSKVDKLGGAIVYCTTRAGIQCGGYNPKGWVGYGEGK